MEVETSEIVPKKADKPERSKEGMSSSVAADHAPTEAKTQSEVLTMPGVFDFKVPVREHFRRHLDSQFRVLKPATEGNSVFGSSVFGSREFGSCEFVTVPMPTSFDLWAEQKLPDRLFDFSNKQICKFSDMRIRSCDGEELYFHRMLLMSSDLEVLKVSLDRTSEIESSSTQLELPFPGWAICLALNAIVGKNIKDWDFLLGALRVLIRYGSTTTVQRLLKDMEAKPLPWPVAELEKIFAEAHLPAQKLASMWLAAPGPSTFSFTSCNILPPIKESFVGEKPSEMFWRACEAVPDATARRISLLVFPHHEVRLECARKVHEHMLKVRGTNRDQAREDFKFLVKHHSAAPSVRRLIISLTGHAIGSERQ